VKPTQGQGISQFPVFGGRYHVFHIGVQELIDSRSVHSRVSQAFIIWWLQSLGCMLDDSIGEYARVNPSLDDGGSDAFFSFKKYQVVGAATEGSRFQGI
jgi:hypothetical protein